MRFGFAAVSKNIKPINTKRLESELDASLRGLSLRIVQIVQKYPPVPAESTYERTLMLQHSWHVSRTAPLQYSITNNAIDRYGRYYSAMVHGPDSQRALHAAHGWQNIRTVVEQVQRTGAFARQTQIVIDEAANTFTAAVSA